MSLLERALARIVPPDESARAAAQAILDRKTKPRRSLGRLEDLACLLAAVRGEPAPRIARKTVVVMAGDHGVADEGVSAYPREVTGQMLLNFAGGGAAINVLAARAGADVLIVDMGSAADLPEIPKVRSRRIAAGTRNLARGPAMSREEALRALEAGVAIAEELADGGAGLLGLGDMGIGNTTASSALVAALLGLTPEEAAGRGTGVDDAGLFRKREAIRRGLAANRPDPSDPLDVLAKLGGFEIAGLAGVCLGAAARRVPVMLDGFITGAAALVASRLAPAAAGYMIASHRSVEPAHGRVLEALGLAPLLDLQLRLGEGSGAALAMGLVDAALAVLHDMATFDAARVTDTGA